MHTCRKTKQTRAKAVVTARCVLTETGTSVNAAGPDSKVERCFICRPAKCGLRCTRRHVGGQGHHHPACAAGLLLALQGSPVSHVAPCTTWKERVDVGVHAGIGAGVDVDLTALQTPLSSLKDRISFQVSPQSSPSSCTLHYSPKLEIIQAAPQQLSTSERSTKQ